MKNPFGKTVKQETPYAVYVDPRTGFEYRVLKTYQRPDLEVKNEFARWFMAVKSPFTHGSYELGDGYARDVMVLQIVTSTPEWREHYSDFSK